MNPILERCGYFVHEPVVCVKSPQSREFDGQDVETLQVSADRSEMNRLLNSPANMLLISRLREESANNIRVGVMRTVASTGSVITSAGLIFAASMFGLMVGSIGIMIQMGFIIGCGLLLDTFVVRTLTVPAMATLLGEASWWPKHRV